MYLNNADFTRHILDYRSCLISRNRYRLLSEPRVAPAGVDYTAQKVASEIAFQKAESLLVSDLYLLADNILKIGFVSVADREDAKQHAVMICLTKLDRYRESKGKAFNFFTAVILNSCKQVMRQSKAFESLRVREFDRLYSGGHYRNGHKAFDE